MIPNRIDLLVGARDSSSIKALSLDKLVEQTLRFAPASIARAEWRAEVERSRSRVAEGAKKLLADELHLKSRSTWKQLAERYLPAFALGVLANDTAVLRKLGDRDAWTAAIAARMMGLWDKGPPPSLSTVCDAFAWRALGLSGRVKRCPPEIRALFLQRNLNSDPAAPDRQLRLFVARELECGTELRSMRDALVRRWLMGREVAASSFASDIRRVAGAETRETFGHRKVFIASVWDGLRAEPRWSSLTLQAFKSQLLAAQRNGDVELARADLVAAMDPKLVARSEAVGDGATFHFIVRENCS